uniref:CSON001653 protein n=1 Tax=Culicoides sonorensis TaxID=179676 RepID=A0A336MNG9_CULSO
MAAPIELDTADKLEYNFYPVSNGMCQFRVRAPNDAHLAFCSEAVEADPMYEVFLGGWKNTKSVIRKNRTKPDVAETETPDILNDGEFRGFWVRWGDNTIMVGHEGQAAAFLTYEDTETVPINYVGVCTGWGACGSWIIEDDIKLETPDKLNYNFNPITSGALTVQFKGPSNCHIALTPQKLEIKPICEMIIGGWNNTASVIRLDMDKNNELAKVETKNIVSNDKFTIFYIHWSKKGLVVRLDGPSGLILMQAENCIKFPVYFFGIRTAWGATGSWKIKQGVQMIGKGTQPSAPVAAMLTSPGSGVPNWVVVNGGEIPPNAVQGGLDIDGAPLYIGRANHEGAVIPGKVVPTHGVCYIPWGGAENPKSEYEVLCDANGHWVACSGTEIPGQAFVAGSSEDGEPLFVGRVTHEGTQTIGKVQQSHGVCYIPFGGEEVAYTDYEIFITQ